MANNLYPATSPYYLSDIYQNQFLDIMVNRTIPRYEDDIYWEITAAYNYRPDMLASDMYNDSRLWWVFAARNPNTLPDPLFSFVDGVKIYLPKLSTLKDVLGI
jgi:hypothetical protein